MNRRKRRSSFVHIGDTKMVAEATVGSVLVTVFVVAAFAYFIYRRVTRKKTTSTGTGVGGGGGGRGDGPPAQQE